jgi:hypothetical protein
MINAVVSNCVLHISRILKLKSAKQPRCQCDQKKQASKSNLYLAQHPAAQAILYLVSGFLVGTVINQQPHTFQVTFAGSINQRRRSILQVSPHISPQTQQTNGFSCKNLKKHIGSFYEDINRHHQRALFTYNVASLFVCSGLQKQFNAFRPSVATGAHQRCPFGVLYM